MVVLPRVVRFMSASAALEVRSTTAVSCSVMATPISIRTVPRQGAAPLATILVDRLLVCKQGSLVREVMTAIPVEMTNECRRGNLG